MKIRILLLCLLLVLLPRPAQGQDAVSDLLGRINALRTSLGLHPYTYSAVLSVAAQNHASWMAETGQVSHAQPDGSTASVRAARAGYPSRAVSENIYMGSLATAATAWQWWLNSPIHYRGITSGAYTEIGIGAASGSAGQAFVLVFGNPNGWGAVPLQPAASGANSGDGGQPSQPAFVLGLDEHGNIMHEVQEGHTLGDIALIYGYTWDDLETIRQLNEMTEPEGRNLQVGMVVLIPPHGGTHTPTPEGAAPEMTAEAESTEELSDDIGILPTLTPTPGGQQSSANPTPTSIDIAALAATSAVMPEWIVETEVASTVTPVTPQGSGSSWTAATVTLLPTPTPSPAAVADASVAAGASALVDSPAEREPVVRDRIPPLLIAAVVFQAVLLVGAGFEFWRRSKK